MCLMCLKEYERLEECYECEDKHKKDNDDYYLKWLDRESRERLRIAGNNPFQKHL